MQTIRDATFLLGIIVLLTSVRIAPVEALGEILPVGTVQAADGDTIPAAVEAGAPAVPAVQVLSRRAVEKKVERSEQKAGVPEACSGSVIRVKTLDIDGRHVILRIDTGTNAVTAGDSLGWAARTALKPCKIG